MPLSSLPARRLCEDLLSAWARAAPTGHICFGAPPIGPPVPTAEVLGINASAISARQAGRMQPLKIEDILPHLWISGRSSRAEWWRVHILCGVLAVMVEHAMMDALAPRADGSIPPISLLWPIASLALAWVSFASVVRRFHDRGKSGWWALLYFVPGIGWLWILVECGFLPGKPSVTHTYNPAPMPAPVPESASRTAARLQATRRVSTVQRAERRPWDRTHMMKAANVAVRFAIAAVAAVMLYKMALDPEGFGVFKVQSMRTVD